MMMFGHFLSLLLLILSQCSGCYGFSNYKAASDIKLLSKERFLRSCQKYQSTEINAEVDLEGFGLPTRTMSITPLVKFISTRPDVASVTAATVGNSNVNNILSGHAVGTSMISIAISPTAAAQGATVLIPAQVEVTDQSTSIESLSVAAVTGVEYFTSASAAVSSSEDNSNNTVINNSSYTAWTTPSFAAHQNLHLVGDRANISVYANFDDGTYMDVTAEANVESLSAMLNITRDDAFGLGLGLGLGLPQLVVLNNQRVDSYLLLAEYQTCPGRVVTGVGRVVVDPPLVSPSTAVPTIAPSIAPSLVPTAANNTRPPTLLPTFSPSLYPTQMPSPYESVLPSSMPTALLSTEAGTASPTGVPSAFPTMILSHYPTSIITPAPTTRPTSSEPSTAAPTDSPTNTPSSQAPNGLPSNQPSTAPSGAPSTAPTTMPSSSSSKTLSPSASPTIVIPPPTFAPTLIPSSSPTSLPTIAVDIATPFTYLVHPEISIDNNADGTVSGGFPMRPFPTLSGKSTWAMPLGMLFPGGGSVSVSGSGASNGLAAQPRTVGITLGGRRIGSQELHIHGDAIANISVVVKTPVVYSSERVLAVAYQVRDAAGSTLVEPGEMVQMQVHSLQTDASMMIDCLSPELPSGIASCTGVLPAAWFVPVMGSAGGLSVEVMVISVNSGVQSAPTLPVVLIPAPEYVPAPAGVLVSMPIAPVFVGSSFVVDITANTEFKVLTAWKISVHYDPLVLEMQVVNTAETYSPASIVRTNGTTRLSCRGLNVTTAYSQVNGTAVALVSVRFKVRPGVTVQLYDNLVRLAVLDLITSDVSMSGQMPPTIGLFRDRRPVGNYPSGQLLIKRHQYMGLLPYAIQSELVDTGALNGVPIMSPIVSMGVGNDPDDTSCTDLTAQSTCGHVDTSVGSPSDLPLTVDKCVVSTASGCTLGSNRIPVPVIYSGSNASMPVLTSAVPFRVWCASTIAVKVLDKVLNAIEV